MNVEAEIHAAGGVVVLFAGDDVLDGHLSAAADAAAFAHADLLGSGDDGDVLPWAAELAQIGYDRMHLAAGADGRLADLGSIVGGHAVFVIRHQRENSAVQQTQRGRAVGRLDAGVAHELGDFRHSANVLRTILRRESKILVEPMPDVVTIEDIRVHAE